MLLYIFSKVSLDCYQVRYRKKGGADPTCWSEPRVGFTDRAVEGGIPKESAKPYFHPQIS